MFEYRVIKISPANPEVCIVGDHQLGCQDGWQLVSAICDKFVYYFLFKRDKNNDNSRSD